MKIKFFCPIWGMVPDYIDKIEGDLPAILEKIKTAGYDGVEMAIPYDDLQKAEIADVLKKINLDLIALQWAANGENLQDYLVSYQSHISNAKKLNPLFINSQTGADFFNFEDNDAIIKYAQQLEGKLKIKIMHETHRGKFSFHAASIQKYLLANPNIYLTADFSHWCSVSESYLQNQSQNVFNAIEKCHHIHARVGHPQAAQVTDPRAPEWQQALNYHLKWWDAIISNHKKIGSKTITITPEFGPPNYMPILPFTQQPVANQWEINNWIKDLLKARYINF